MSNDRTKILNMLAEGKISVDEAERLLNALDGSSDNSAPEKTEKKKRPKFLKVAVNSVDKSSGKPETVNISVPLQLLRAGIKLKSILPGDTHDKVSGALHDKGVNFDFNDLDGDSIDSLIEALAELSIDVDSDEDKVRIYCE